MCIFACMFKVIDLHYDTLCGDYSCSKTLARNNLQPDCNYLNPTVWPCKSQLANCAE